MAPKGWKRNPKTKAFERATPVVEARDTRPATDDERLLHALAYAVGALLREHHTTPAQREDDRKIARVLWELFPRLQLKPQTQNGPHEGGPQSQG